MPSQTFMFWRYSLFARPGKTTVTFEIIGAKVLKDLNVLKWCNFEIPMNLKCPKALLHSLYNYCLRYLLRLRPWIFPKEQGGGDRRTHISTDTQQKLTLRVHDFY